MSASQKYLDQLEVFASWGRWDDRLRGRFHRQVRSRIEEIRAGAVMPDDESPGCWAMEVSTASGARRFRQATEVTEGDTQSESVPVVWEPEPVAELARHLIAVVRWLSAEDRRPATDRVENCPEVMEPTSTEILATLRARLSHQETYRKAIINAEVIDFGPDETRILSPLLRAYIEQHRESNDAAELVAVGSAIRKFVAVASVDEALDFAAALLQAGHQMPLPIGIEVELSKMVVRKLTANPPARHDQYSDLAGRLLELAETYLNPRLLAREKHGAVALNAVLGIVLTRDPLASKVVDRVHSVGVGWFQQVVAREAAKLASDARRRWAGESLSELVKSLENLTIPACTASSTQGQ